MGQSQSVPVQSEHKYLSNITVQWEWQSNPNPWSSSEPKEWTPYAPADNYLLEKAYQNQEKKVELGDFIIFLREREMVQQRKDDAYKQRRVRRNEESQVNKQEENARKKRFFGVETPKTYNKTFGSLEHFLVFFENRGPEIKKFVTLFKEIEQAQDMVRLNQQILQLVINSIKAEAVQSKKVNGVNQILSLFQKEFPNMKQFYEAILKAYTMNTFLYTNLNRYLRNEDWTSLDCLLPYAFCLGKAFLSPEFNKNVNANNGQGTKITLYRGALFDEVAISFYDSQIGSNFSWNGVTSTSTNRKVAEEFMNSNIDPKKIPVMFIIETPPSPDELENLNWIDIKPFSVFPTEDEIVLGPGSTFKLTNFHRDQKGVEISLSLVSNMSIIAYQGQIMHGIMQGNMVRDKVAKIGGLKGKDLEEAITHLTGNKLIEELELSSGHFDADTLARLQETLPTLSNVRRLACASLSSNENNHLDVILKILNKKKIDVLEVYDKLLENEKYMRSFGDALKVSSKFRTLNLDFNRLAQFSDKCLTELSSRGLRYMTSLTALTLNFHHCRKITGEGLTSLSSHGLRYLTSLKTLSLDFEVCDSITDEGLTNLGSQGLRHMSSLTTLILKFAYCSAITDKGLTSLSLKGLKHMTLLTTLTLDFKFCRQITGEGLSNLSSQGLRYLTSLKTLTLDFLTCMQITSNGLTSLSSQGLRYMTSLKTLTLNFGWCEDITEEGLANLGSQGLKHTTSLTTLTLDFRGCYIKNELLASLCSEGLRHMTLLTTLNLKFDFHDWRDTWSVWDNLKAETMALGVSLTLNEEGTTNTMKTYEPKRYNFKREIRNQLIGEGKLNQEKVSASAAEAIYVNSLYKLEQLYSKFSEESTPLTSVRLKFYDVNTDFSDQQLMEFCVKGAKQLVLFTSLTLNFEKCYKITKEGLTNLSSQGLKHMTSLTTLTLDFKWCGITDEALTSLSSQGLRYMTSLTTLTLNFGHCDGITDEGLISLSSQGLKHMSSLTTLTLDFKECKQITNEGLTSLSSGGLRHMASLQTLALDFSWCEKITDKGLTNLSSQGLRHMTSLIALTLDFSDWADRDNISDEGLTNLSSQGLRYMTSLTTLTLNFSGCKQVTDEGLANLSSQGLRHVTSLKTLTLHFKKCNITDEGLNKLSSQGLKYMTSLQILTLNFYWCKQVTDKGLTSLSSQGLGHITSLKTLNLDFQECGEITDEGLTKLSSQGLKYMTSLQILTLNFGSCDGITDEGLTNLSSQGLRHMTSLTTLSLNFGRCGKITDKGLTNLSSQGLRHMTSLIDLTLDFSVWDGWCNITDEGLTNLGSQGLRHMTSLTSLTLDFSRSEKISDEGLTNLCSQGIKQLTSLTTLNLNFEYCSKVSSQGLRDLILLLKYFGFHP